MTMTLPPPERLTEVGKAQLDAVEAAIAAEVGLPVEAAVLVVCVRAPDRDQMDYYSLAFHGAPDDVDELEPDVRVALAWACHAAGDNVAPEGAPA